MDNDSDLIPTFVVHLFIIAAGVLVLAMLITSFSQPIYNFAQAFVDKLQENLNRLGLIFQTLGIFSVLPDLLEKKREEIWNKRLAFFGEQLNRDNFSVTSLFRTLSFAVIGRAEGLLGFVIYVSNTISFVIIHIAVFFFLPWALGPTYRLIYLLDIVLLLGAYGWLISEILVRRFRATGNDEWSYSVKILRAYMFLACGGLFLFSPILVITLPIAYLVRWSSRHSLRFVFITITFPFILVGMLCQLVASFL